MEELLERSVERYGKGEGELGGGGELPRLDAWDGLPGYARQARELRLREAASRSSLAQAVLQNEVVFFAKAWAEDGEDGARAKGAQLEWQRADSAR